MNQATNCFGLRWHLNCDNKLVPKKMTNIVKDKKDIVGQQQDLILHWRRLKTVSLILTMKRKEVLRLKNLVQC